MTAEMENGRLGDIEERRRKQVQLERKMEQLYQEWYAEFYDRFSKAITDNKTEPIA